MSVTYHPGAPPKVTVDCGFCDGTGIGQHGDPNTSRCSYCAGRGYHTHTVDPLCGCAGCRTFRGELCATCGKECPEDDETGGFRTCAECDP